MLNDGLVLISTWYVGLGSSSTINRAYKRSALFKAKLFVRSVKSRDTIIDNTVAPLFTAGLALEGATRS